MTVSASSKKFKVSKVTVSIREKNPSPIARMKDSFKNTFSLDRQKSLSPAEVSEKICKEWFVLARKSVSATQNEIFVRKYISTIQKNCFFWQKKKNQRKWFPIAGKCFPFKIGSPNFNNGFQHQKKSSKQKHTVSTREKISFH